MTMEPENDHPKMKAIKILEIDNTNEFPELSSSPNPPTQKPVIASNWGSLFASKVPKEPRPIHHTSLPHLSITPTKEMRHGSHLIEEKEDPLVLPTTAECMSILSCETTETAVERGEVDTPWDSPTAKKHLNISPGKDENTDSDTAIIFPDFIATDTDTDTDTSEPPQKEPHPPFKFPATEAEPEVNIYNASPKLTKVEEMAVEELSEAERHNTPSYIRGGLPLRQVVENDPDRVIHAIRHMMNGIVQMRRKLGAAPEEIEFLINNHQSALNEIDFLTENERVARLAVERRESANKDTRLAMEKERSTYANELENSKSTKFNPSAKPFSPSNFMSTEFTGSTPPFAVSFLPTTQIQSPLKYSVLHEPGFMVEQSRTPPVPYKFHPLLNRSRTWSTHRPSIGPIVPAGPYSHFNAYNSRPMSPMFARQVQSPFPMVTSPLPLYSFTNVEVDLQQETIVRTPPQSPTSIQSQLPRPLANTLQLRTPVSGKTDHKSTPTSPTKELSADPSFKATSTNTSPRRKTSDFHKTYHQLQFHQPKLHNLKMTIPTTYTADDIQKAILQVPRTHRHICPSSLISPDFKCSVPDCLLQQICPDFTSENGCSFHPPPLSDWPWNYPSRNPLANQDKQCQFVHISGTCLKSLSYYHGTESSSEATLDNPPDLDPTTQSHYCTFPKCSTTRVHSWGCAKDWKTGFAANGTTPAAQHYEMQIHQSSSEVSTDWRWRIVMEGLRTAHERGDYGCKGGSIPINAAFPVGHKGGDPRNWGPSILPTKAKSKNGKPCGKDRERGRLMGGGNGGGGGSSRGK